jgi:hypothetical protein
MAAAAALLPPTDAAMAAWRCRQAFSAANTAICATRPIFPPELRL